MLFNTLSNKGIFSFIFLLQFSVVTFSSIGPATATIGALLNEFATKPSHSVFDTKMGYIVNKPFSEAEKAKARHTTAYVLTKNYLPFAKNTYHIKTPKDIQTHFNDKKEIMFATLNVPHDIQEMLLNPSRLNEELGDKVIPGSEEIPHAVNFTLRKHKKSLEELSINLQKACKYKLGFIPRIEFIGSENTHPILNPAYVKSFVGPNQRLSYKINIDPALPTEHVLYMYAHEFDHAAEFHGAQGNILKHIISLDHMKHLSEFSQLCEHQADLNSYINLHDYFEKIAPGQQTVLQFVELALRTEYDYMVHEVADKHKWYRPWKVAIKLKDDPESSHPADANRFFWLYKLLETMRNKNKS